MRFRSDSDKWLVINALRSMAGTYEEDAKLFPVGHAFAKGNAPIRQQLLDQAENARRIADQIEQED